ncbi:MAG: SusC/RagA family TonB-linked outer membrane protein [Culturomica sp.]|nr:SusC/RagA family TonB-linked outer membrane protein [Culturomica sp.]
MKLARYSLLVITLLVGSVQLFAQNRILRGTIRDASGAMPGVHVYVLTENQRVLTGVISDANGEYYVSIPPGDGLKISYSFIGYKTQEIVYTGQTTLNITLEESSLALDAVTVMGSVSRNDMGVNVKNVVSSTERLTLEGIEELPVTSLGEALQGKLANVDIISTSGAPGAGSAIRIRGISSLSVSSEPLIVLNGVPYNTQLREGFDFATATDEDLSGLVNLSPSDIESIEVLKDAAATAPWGAQGANGVLMITSKKGAKGKMVTTVTEKFSLKFEPESIKQLNGNQYVSLMQDELWNWGFDTYMDFDKVRQLLRDGINFNPNYIYWKEYDQNTDWLNEITRDVSTSSETNVSLEGGGDRAIYRFSASYLTERGTTIGEDFNRVNATLYLLYNFTDNFSVQTEMMYGQGNRNQPFHDPRSAALRKMPNMSPYFMEEDNVTRTGDYFTPYSTLQGNYDADPADDKKHFNPVAMVNESTKNTESRDMRLRLTLDYRITPNLRYLGNLSFSVNTYETHAFLPQIVTGVYKTSANYNLGTTNNDDNTSLYVSNNLQFNKTFFEKLHVSAAAKTDMQSSAAAAWNNKVSGSASPELSAPQTGGIIRELKSSSSERRTFSMMGSLHFSYLERYLLSGTYNYSASSVMNTNNRWLGMPSIGIGWRIDNEPFMANYKEMLSLLKVRASWGINGNNPTSGFPSAGRFTNEGYYGGLGAVGPTTMELSKMGWEKKEKQNVGLDLELFNGKYFFSFDYYKDLTKNMLQKKVTIPSHTGYTQIEYYNSGEMSNEGWEFRASANNIPLTENWRLNASMNISGNNNKILKLPDNKNFMQYPDKATNKEYAITITEGDPLGAFYGFKCLGVYSDPKAVWVRDRDGNLLPDISGNPIRMRHEEREVRPGDAHYQDMNQDGVIDRYDITYLGHAMPKITGGFGLGISYKQLRLQSDFHYRLKYDVVNDTRMHMESMDGYDNQSVAVLDRWRYEGDVTGIPRAIHGNANHYNTLGSDRFVEDASFLRLKTLSLSYSVPRKRIERLGLSQLSLGLTAYNLLTWTNYTGQDPEVNINGGMNENGDFVLMGVDKSRTPVARRVSFNMTVKF